MGLQDDGKEQRVYVAGFDMPFGDMVVFMVKWAVATIPAAAILCIFALFFLAFFGALFK